MYSNLTIVRILTSALCWMSNTNQTLKLDTWYFVAYGLPVYNNCTSCNRRASAATRHHISAEVTKYWGEGGSEVVDHRSDLNLDFFPWFHGVVSVYCWWTKAKQPLLETVMETAASKRNEGVALSTQQQAASIQCDGGKCEYVLQKPLPNSVNTCKNCLTKPR